jgi:hypothetical protein
MELCLPKKKKRWGGNLKMENKTENRLVDYPSSRKQRESERQRGREREREGGREGETLPRGLGFAINSSFQSWEVIPKDPFFKGSSLP